MISGREPGRTEPGARGAVESGPFESAALESAALESGVVESGGLDSGVVGLGGAESAALESGVVESGVVESGVAGSDVAGSDVAESGVLESAVVGSGAVESGGLDPADTGGPGGRASGPRRSVPWGVGHLRVGLAATAVIAAIGAPLAWAVAGGRAAIWVVAGQVVVATFFGVGAVAVAWAGGIADSLTLPVALGTYVTKVALLGALLVPIRDATWSDPVALGWSILAGTLAWTGAQCWRAWTARVCYTDPGLGPPAHSPTAR